MSSLEAEVLAAKAFLLKTSSSSGNNLYDHLSDCLSRILDERSENAVDHFETISRISIREKLKPRFDALKDQQEPSSRAELAILQKPLFSPSEDQETDVDAEEDVDIPFPDLPDVMNCFEQGGVGLGKDEMYRILLALKKLTADKKLASVRFWGKIFGTQANYIIAEAEYPEDATDEDEDEEEEEEGSKQEEGDGAGSGEPLEAGEEEEEEPEEDVPPKSQWKPPPVIPKEDSRTGTNKKTYFVCNQPGDPWVKLPRVDPAQIVVARQIRKLMTGALDAPVVSYPPFPKPGLEKNYLRAQIARISATTHVSPRDYFQAEGDEDEEVEDGEGSEVIEPNKEFEITKISEYADGTMGNWSHHVSYILPQGTCKWFNPVQKTEDEFDEEEDEDDEDKEQPDEPEPETGPSLLQAVSEDATVDGMPAWSARLSSNIVPQYAVAVVSSNLWPGGHAFAVGRKFENVYIGWGIKQSSTAFDPALPPAIMEEYPAGADIMEVNDPTVEQEATARAAQEEEQAAAEEEEEPEESDDD